ncbi:MAG: DUF4846 domain-containing protein [Ichthyobacteriaceae bacterium]|nr:DUF4846 domain-containing protein [Ichthyobacteriaceae bacterium]
MKKSIFAILLTAAIVTLVYAGNNSEILTSIKTQNLSEKQNYINPLGATVETRFSLPQNFKRINVKDNSFEQYLRTLPLKPDGADVIYYDGNVKENYGVYTAVVDLEIGKRDLHQCADAVMRLRAEYLWNREQYDDIHFNFTNGMKVDYSNWMNGERINIVGNKTNWYNATSPSNEYKDFWKYMEIIFSYAGTYSLSKELKPTSTSNISIGDVFIQGGFPGHAIIVVDMAENKKTHKKVFMLAQSYMPAQDLQILVNPNSDNNSPWYSDDFGDLLETPEWNFNKEDLKRF